METPREVVTYFLLGVLTNRGVLFDPILHAAGADSVEAAIAQNKGVILVGVHSMLSVLALRRLWDLGLPFAVVARPPLTVPGTTAAVQTIAPSFTYMLEIVSLLRSNAIVAAMIDRAPPTSKTTAEVPTENGPVAITDALIRMAVRAGVPVVFFATRLRGSDFVITYAGPAADQPSSVDTVTSAFVSFVQEHVAGVTRSV